MPEITLSITFDPDTGHFKVLGPIRDKLTCYGLLDMARDVVREAASQQLEQSRIVMPRSPFGG